MGMPGGMQRAAEAGSAGGAARGTQRGAGAVGRSRARPRPRPWSHLPPPPPPPAAAAATLGSAASSPRGLRKKPQVVTPSEPCVSPKALLRVCPASKAVQRENCCCKTTRFNLLGSLSGQVSPLCSSPGQAVGKQGQAVPGCRNPGLQAVLVCHAWGGMLGLLIFTY
ncbi:uncharacterized protein O9250_005558 [Rhynochetos jubatus]